MQHRCRGHKQQRCISAVACLGFASTNTMRPPAASNPPSSTPPCPTSGPPCPTSQPSAPVTLVGSAASLLAICCSSFSMLTASGTELPSAPTPLAREPSQSDSTAPERCTSCEPKWESSLPGSVPEAADSSEAAVLERLAAAALTDSGRTLAAAARSCGIAGSDGVPDNSWLLRLLASCCDVASGCWVSPSRALSTWREPKCGSEPASISWELLAACFRGSGICEAIAPRAALP